MKNMINKRNTIIIILCTTIILMALAFSYLSMQLANLKQKRFYHDVSIEKVEKLTPIQGGKTLPTATHSLINSKKTIDMQFNLAAPRDEVSYKITIKNKGTNKSKIVGLVEAPDYLNNAQTAATILPAKITHNNITGTTLEPEEEVVLTVIAYFPKNGTPIPIKIPYQISILSESINN